VTGQPGRCDRAAVGRPNAKEDEMGVVLVRQKVKDGSVQEAEVAVRDLFATLDRVGPEGFLTELADGSYNLFGTQRQESTVR
jgi:hypothetical protein